MEQLLKKEAEQYLTACGVPYKSIDSVDGELVTVNIEVTNDCFKRVTRQIIYKTKMIKKWHGNRCFRND
jgi:hypothetical protein